MKSKMAFGGGCHWCTEAVFDHLSGVQKVEQGWVKSTPPADTWSEAVIVHFDTEIITIAELIGVHLYTHAATSAHPLRSRYRSAIYYFTPNDAAVATEALTKWQADFSATLLTQVLPYEGFKTSLPAHLNYYATDPERPFCSRYIKPKLDTIRQRFSTLLAAR